MLWIDTTSSRRECCGVEAVMVLIITFLIPIVMGDNAKYSIDLIGIQPGTAYTLAVNVGTPKTGVNNTFRLIADTGSSNDAVLGPNCCGGDALVTYSCDTSSTCVQGQSGVTFPFSGATISGSFVKDEWKSKQFGTISKDFLVIDKQDTFYRPDYEGITGLAYKALAQPKINPHPSLYDNLVANGNTRDSFGMLLCGIVQPLLKNSKYSLHAGQLVVGGSEGPAGEMYYTPPMLYTPIAQQSWFVVIVTDIAYGGKSLGLPCTSYNEPQAIIDSGTSNLAFPSNVYNALMTQIQAATKKAVPQFNDVYFDYRKSCCVEIYCDPRDPKAALLTLPSISITFAMQEAGDTSKVSRSKRHYTVEIPPQYYFRPEMNGNDNDIACRAIGIAEGSSIVLGDVLMDGLYTYHDRAEGVIGIAVANNCPNGVQSTKKIAIAESKTTDWCDCFSEKLKVNSLLASALPWKKPCFFVVWWMYVILVCVVVIFICIGVVLYWWWKGRHSQKIPAIDVFAPDEDDDETVNPQRFQTRTGADNTNGYTSARTPHHGSTSTTNWDDNALSREPKFDRARARTLSRSGSDGFVI